MKLIYYIALFVALTCASCNKMAEIDDINKNIQITRVSFSPLFVQLDSIGQTSEDETGQEVIITINPISQKKLDWNLEIEKGKTWCKFEKNEIQDEYGTIHRGFKVTTEKNNGYKRWANIYLTIANGVKDTFQVIQSGQFPDAQVNFQTKQIEFNADDITPVNLLFTTNMGDIYSIHFDDGIDWIKYTVKGNDTLNVTVDEWGDEENEREGYMYITVGSLETSIATDTVHITQLAKDIYFYLWGNILPDYPNLDVAPRMKKGEEGIYTFDAYFWKTGTPKIQINNSTKPDVYPAFALDANNKIIKLKSDEDAIPEGPTIDIDGMRTLLLDMNTMTYTINRISTSNCMPDDVAALCPSKDYKAKDGTMRTWMTSNLNWDGGPTIGALKLGSRFISSSPDKTGGYSDQPYPARDPKLDEVENGGELIGDAERTAKYGRIYTLYEVLLGLPQGALSTGYNDVAWPSPYQINGEFIDASGEKINWRSYTGAELKLVTNDEAYYEENPALRVQIQGICPYGWHIANYKDWQDLCYAALDASQGATDYPVVESELSIAGLVYLKGKNANNVVEWLRASSDWEKTPKIASGAAAFGFNLYPSGWRLYKDGYCQFGQKAHLWVPLIGSSEKKTWRVNNITESSNFCMYDNLDAGNPAVPIRCVRNYKIVKKNVSK